MSDRLCWQIQKHAKALLPLIEQLLPVDHNQSIDLALCNQPCGDGCLPECRRSAQDAFVMTRDLSDGFLLKWPKLSLELGFNRRSREPFVVNLRPNLVRFKKGQCLRQTP